MGHNALLLFFYARRTALPQKRCQYQVSEQTSTAIAPSSALTILTQQFQPWSRAIGGASDRPPSAKTQRLTARATEAILCSKLAASDRAAHGDVAHNEKRAAPPVYETSGATTPPPDKARRHGQRHSIMR